jgi:ribosomal-protein-alanine N-acetyltransferase
MAEPARVRASVRLPGPGDVRALESAELLCFSDPWPAQFFVSELFAPGRFQRLLVAPGGEMVAYLFCSWQYLDLHVLKVATLPEYRRTGLASRLMALAERHVEEMGGDSLTLEVRPSNLTGLTMYDALGYHRAGVRRHYYADGENAIVMVKEMRRFEVI